MNVFDGQSTVRPRTPRNSSAASAAPAQLPVATAGRPFQAAHDVLELARDRAFRPLLGVERGLPERMQTHAVAVVEADGERIEVHERRR